MMVHTYQATQDPRYLYRAIQLQQFVLQYPALSDPATMRQPQPASDAYDLWVGSYESAVSLWTSFLYAGPANAHMTGFVPFF